MTTAHRPTFDPARGKEALRGPAYHQRLLPAHTHLKYRKAGQGGAADDQDTTHDLAAELLRAESLHFKKNSTGAPIPDDEDNDDDHHHHHTSSSSSHKRSHHHTSTSSTQQDQEEDIETKRRRILAETRDIDAESDSDSDSNPKSAASSDNDDDDDDDDVSDSDDDDDEDEDAELQRELERVRQERQEKKKREEEEAAKLQEEARERDIALGNPLLNKQDFTMKRRWDDDVVFKNQARGTEERGKKKEFVNDLIRSDFHRKFMGKYVR